MPSVRNRFHDGFISLIFLAASTSCAFSQPSLPAHLQPLMQELDKTAMEATKDPDSGSLTLGLVTRDGLVWTKSYGYADIEKKTPASADSVYRIGSITKQF